MRKLSWRLSAATALSVGTLLVVVGCAPGSAPGSASGSSSASASGGPSKQLTSAKVTLTVWDQNIDPGINDAQKALNEEFQKAHPNVTINRVARSFSDLKTTLKLALSSNNPPDVVQANQGYPDMGAFVEAGLLRPINDYASLYGWDNYYPQSVLKLNSFSADGKHWQGDNLYGISQTGEVVGIYYNKQVLSRVGITPPKTLTELQAALPKIKAAGIQPISFGNLEKSPGIHLYAVVQAAVAGPEKVRQLVTAQSGAWTDPAQVQTATIVQNWANQGYLTKGANGISRDATLADFAKGKAAFNINGTWQQAKLEQQMGAKNVGFLLLDANGTSSPASEGGVGLAWAITSKSKNPDVAAAYIDFIAGKQSAQALIKAGNLPAVLPADYNPESGTVGADIVNAYRALSKDNGLLPYLDYTTPTFYDTLTSGMQDLLADRATPQQFTEKLEADYEAFKKRNA